MSEQQGEVSKTTERLNELSKRHSDELSKYTYFVLAAAGAAIAYALNLIEKNPPSYLLLFIAFAILLWSISFGFGVRHLYSLRQHISANANCILQAFTGEQMQEALQPWERRAHTASSCQFAFLIGGALSLLTFHVVKIITILPT